MVENNFFNSFAPGTGLYRDKIDSDPDPEEDRDTDLPLYLCDINYKTQPPETHDDEDPYGQMEMFEQDMGDLTSYQKSIEDLRLEARALLQRSPRQEKLEKGLKAVLHRPKENMTILKLLWEDRERVGTLISDLADSKQKILSLNAKLARQQAKDKKLRSLYIKKIDALQERVQMLKANENCKCEEYAETLRILNNKLAEAAKETEESAKQTEILKAELTELAKVAQDNKELREKLAELKRTSKEFKKHEKDYPKTNQKDIRSTQTKIGKDCVGNPAGNVNQNQGKRKINLYVQKNEAAYPASCGTGDLLSTHLHPENDRDKNKRKKNLSSVPVPVPHSYRRKENVAASNLNEVIPMTAQNSFTANTPATEEYESEEDDLIRELFFKF